MRGRRTRGTQQPPRLAAGRLHVWPTSPSRRWLRSCLAAVRRPRPHLVFDQPTAGVLAVGPGRAYGGDETVVAGGVAAALHCSSFDVSDHGLFPRFYSSISRSYWFQRSPNREHSQFFISVRRGLVIFVSSALSRVPVRGRRGSARVRTRTRRRSHSRAAGRARSSARRGGGRPRPGTVRGRSGPSRQFPPGC